MFCVIPDFSQPFVGIINARAIYTVYVEKRKGDLYIYIKKKSSDQRHIIIATHIKRFTSYVPPPIVHDCTCIFTRKRLFAVYFPRNPLIYRSLKPLRRITR